MCPERQQQEIRYNRNERNPTQSTNSNSKSIISSLVSTFSPTTTTTTDDTNKCYFTSTRFRGLGCRAPPQVSVPSMIRTSANWEGDKKLRKKKTKINNNNNNNGVSLVISPNPPPPLDVWCAPLITDAASVDCLVSTTQKISKTTRERGGRRTVHHEDLPYLDTNRLDVFGGRHHRHVRHRLPQGLSEIVMLQTNLLMGGRLERDRYRDWRLDVDCMSYEELLELGDRIGYVSTGLREDEIGRCVKKTKPPVDKSSSYVPMEMQWKCTICQEEHEEEEGEGETGKLDCGHVYHMYCIKQWLAQKKTCPICKVEVESR